MRSMKKNQRVILCPQCDGEGIIYYEFTRDTLFPKTTWYTCTLCGGTGFVEKGSLNAKPEKNRKEVK